VSPDNLTARLSRTVLLALPALAPAGLGAALPRHLDAATAASVSFLDSHIRWVAE
jgi:hypothetical protein